MWLCKNLDAARLYRYLHDISQLEGVQATQQFRISGKPTLSGTGKASKVLYFSLQEQSKRQKRPKPSHSDL